MTPAGVADTTKGITEIVAGTGGEELRGFNENIRPNSLYRIEGRAGVLLLTLGAAEYRSAFSRSADGCGIRAVENVIES